MDDSRRVPGRRKRGGQPGNRNALRHGLYATHISRAEDDALSRMRITHLEGEIAYMRVVCGRIAQILENNGLGDGETRMPEEPVLRLLSSLDKAMMTLLSYLRMYASQTGEVSQLESDIESGKDLARIAHNVYTYLDPAEKN